MSPTVQRHVQVRADKLKSATLSAAEVDRIIADKAIDRGRLSYLDQVGSARLGTTRYVTFDTRYSSTASVAIARLGSYAYTYPISGSASEQNVMTVVGGSFSAHATPTSYFLWYAQGSA